MRKRKEESIIIEEPPKIEELPKIEEPQKIEEPIIPKQPRIRVKKTEQPFTKVEDKGMKIVVTEMQLNSLVFAGTSGITMLLRKQDLTNEDTKNFTSVLFSIGEQQGWWDKIEFLPYLILIGAGLELGMKIIKQPSKKTQDIVKETILKEMEKSKDEMRPADIGLVDMIDQDALAKKLGGNVIYETTNTETE